MISFKQYISEEEQDIFKLIKRDCAPFLEATEGENFLVRGMNMDNSFSSPISVNSDFGYKLKAYKIKVKKDRKPVHSSKEDFDTQNKWFKKRFDVNVRAEALFCYSADKRGFTKEYGKPYLIFPIGETRIIWSPIVLDLFADYDDTDMEAYLNVAGYRDSGMKSALKSRNSELMVICDEYYALDFIEKDLLQQALRQT